MNLADILAKIPQGALAGVLMIEKVPEPFAELAETLVREILGASDPLATAERAAAAIGSKNASDAIIDATLKMTNVMDPVVPR